MEVYQEDQIFLNCPDPKIFNLPDALFGTMRDGDYVLKREVIEANGLEITDVVAIVGERIRSLPKLVLEVFVVDGVADVDEDQIKDFLARVPGPDLTSYILVDDEAFFLRFGYNG